VALDKGAELGRVLRTVIANELGRAARLGINPKEGVLGRVYGGLKQAAILRVLARRRSLRASPQGAACGVRRTRRLELQRKRRRATEGVRGHVV
jgi:hypothetical protein